MCASEARRVGEFECHGRKVVALECSNADVVHANQRSICLDRACYQELMLPASLDAPSEVQLRT